MPVANLHDTGEEFIIDVHFDESVTKPNSLDVGLYNDNTDGLTQSSDVGDITTEPSGGSYARQSASYGTNFTNSDSSGDWQTKIDDLTFDVSDSSQTIDAYFIVVNFKSDDKSDGSASDHIYWSGGLGSTEDLSNYDGDFKLQDAGLKFD